MELATVIIAAAAAAFSGGGVLLQLHIDRRNQARLRVLEANAVAARTELHELEDELAEDGGGISAFTFVGSRRAGLELGEDRKTLRRGTRDGALVALLRL